MGETALHIAAQYNDGAMIQALLASHADLEELTVDSRSCSEWQTVPPGVLGVGGFPEWKRLCMFVYI